MALLFMDGFDASDFAVKGWTAGNTPVAVASTRFGSGMAVNLPGSTRYLLRGIPYSGKAFVGMAILCPPPLSGTNLLTFYTDTAVTTHMVVRLNADGSVSLLRNVTVVASSAPGLLVAGVWAFLEASCTISDTVGECVVRINGVTAVSFTGDTRNAGTSTQIDAVRISGSLTVDDFYALDATGAAPHNTFLGDVRVMTMPVTGAGANTELTPSAGANWQCVDEMPWSATDYVSGAAAGLKDSYAMGDVSGVSLVYGVQTNVIGRKSDAGARSINHLVRSGGLNYTGGYTFPLNTADATSSQVYVNDPITTVPWTVAGVNAMEMGAEVV
jgi:hypothetical protein